MDINLQNYSNYWNFIQGLEWLQPNVAKATFSIDCEYKSHIPHHMKVDKAAVWLYRNLENHSLSLKLSWLLSDKKHLASCYELNAFLCHKEYSEALLICLRAIERNHSSLLSEINPCLFLNQTNSRAYHKSHRRCFSFPEAHLKIAGLEECAQGRSKPSKKVVRVRLWKSMPNVQCSVEVAQQLRERSKSATRKSDHEPSQLIESLNNLDKPVGCYNKNVAHAADRPAPCGSSKSAKKCFLMDTDKIVEHMPSPSNSSYSSTKENVNFVARSLPETLTRSRLDYNLLDSLSSEMPGEKDYKKKPKKSFIEDGGMSVLPMSTG